MVVTTEQRKSTPLVSAVDRSCYLLSRLSLASDSVLWQLKSPARLLLPRSKDPTTAGTNEVDFFFTLWSPPLDQGILLCSLVFL